MLKNPMRSHNTRVSMRRRPSSLTFAVVVAYAIALAVLAADVLIWRP